MHVKTIWKLILQRPCEALVAVVFIIVQSALNVAEIIILERFINGFIHFQWGPAVIFAASLSGIYAFHYIQTPLLGWLNNRIRLQMRIHLEQAVIEKVARVSVAALENPDNQALLARLQDEPEKRYTNAFFSALQILGGALSTAGVFALIIEDVPFYLPVVLLLLGLMAIAFRLIGKNRVKLYRARQEISRRGDYLSGLLFERRLAQEKKLFGYTPYIQKLYEEETIQADKRMFKSIFLSNMILWFYDNITYLFSASAYLLFLIPLYEGKIHIGLYIAIIPALTRLGAFFVEVGSKHLPTYQEYRASLADMTALNALPEQYYVHEGENSAPPEFNVIKGENIVFRYPGQEKPVLNGLNFVFYAGKNYALVGENGCGKTTLIKLLMGFYQPETGCITIDGKNVQEMEFAELQSFFSAVFQDFNRYDYTVKENILMSNLGKKEPEPEMRQAATETELDSFISSCPDTYDTKLGNLEDGGVDMSGGQWQRLAIARMLYRKAGICIWDEPTASMDPLSESHLYKTFLQKRSGDCVNIFVTHRLGAAVSADEICVLENGRLVEQGNHGELMQKAEGLYRRMFEAQKGMYV